MRRHLIGIIALLLLVGAVYFWVWPPQGSFQTQMEAACWRAGALALVIWLAYGDVHRMPAWFWLSLPVLVIVLAKWPKRVVYVIPIVLALAILRPRVGRRQPKNGSRV